MRTVLRYAAAVLLAVLGLTAAMAGMVCSMAVLLVLLGGPIASRLAAEAPAYGLGALASAVVCSLCMHGAGQTWRSVR
jgi:phosphoribosylcarboxyaminoimidazole (NCAIR) mutase